MSARPVPALRSLPAVSIEGELESAARYAALVLAPATRRAYDHDVAALQRASPVRLTLHRFVPVSYPPEWLRT